MEIIKDFKNTNKKTIAFLLIIVLMTILRIYLGTNLQLWYLSGSIHDDLLMINHSDIYAYFHQWNILSLVKGMSFPLFLFVIRITKIPYSFLLSILWVISSLLTMYVVNKYITKNKLMLALSYIFILFLPIAFDSWSGSRLYRNSIMCPFAIIYLTTLLIFINEAISKKIDYKKLLILGIILGLIFTFNYYIKEDGILTLPILIGSILSIILYNVLINNRKSFLKIVIVAIIPLLIFGASTMAYKELDKHYFGVNEINTRTGGEIGEFWKNLLIIDDKNQSALVWVPYSTLEKVWNVSPTLQSRPDLLDNLHHTHWANGNMSENPISGDIFSWALRDSLMNVGLFNDEKTANDFFKKVNSELNTAFENGDLNKSDKLHLTDLAVGKNKYEIKQTMNFFYAGIKACLFYDRITLKNMPIPDTSQRGLDADTGSVEEIIHDNVITQNELNGNEKIPLLLQKADIKVYKIISYVIVILSVIGFIYTGYWQIKNRFKNRVLNCLLGFELMLLATFLVQIFAVAWFSSWIDINTDPMVFYTVSSQGFFALFEVLSITGLFKIINMKTQLTSS